VVGLRDEYGDNGEDHGGEAEERNVKSGVLDEETSDDVAECGARAKAIGAIRFALGCGLGVRGLGCIGARFVVRFGVS
jgi:hypothetical protein